MDANIKFRILSRNNRSLDNFKARGKIQKTKTGCLTCKAKRVKCDELKPVCVRCMRNSRPCAYSELVNVRTCCGSPSLSVLSAVTVDPLAICGSESTAFGPDVLQHFQRHWNEIFHMPGIHKTIALSYSHPLIFNAILAISACNLRQTSPGNTEHRIAEHSYQSLALEQYRKLLETAPGTLSQTGVESLLLSAMLLNILTFPLQENGSDSDPNTSWVFGPSDKLQGWLALQAGIKPLVISTTTQIDETRRSVGQILFGCDESWPTPNFGLDLATLPYTWVTVFDLEDASSFHVFGQSIAIIRQLQKVEPLRTNVYRNLLFVWKMSTPFRRLLSSKDERALWLFGYWLGLLCRYSGIWWCEKRAKRDYEAIFIFLTQLHLPDRPGHDGVMWSEMMNEFELAPVFGCT